MATDSQRNGVPGVAAHDGSATPSPVELPDLFFRARCAAPSCKALLGGFHIPCVGGMVVFSCAVCGRTTVFKNEAFGIRAVLAGPLVGAKSCGESAKRTRGARGGKNR